MGERDYMDLLDLQGLIRESVADAFPGRYWVKAEIASWSPRSNGHCYVSLVQSRAGKSVAEARAMIWNWKYPQLKTYFEEATGQKLQAGLTVLVRVQVNYSEVYGLTLYIDDIDAAFTLGEQALERRKAIEKLEKEGLMDLQKELALPDLPGRLAVVTSKTAAGYQDFRNHLLKNPQGYAFQLALYEALMQGEQAPASIMEALQEASGKDYDAILILRGGGSELDLQCFDDYDLAVAIATCPVPVVTAIGHDKDVHIADMVAHESVKTPTALADLFLDAFQAQDAVIDALQDRIGSAILHKVNSLELLLERGVGRISRGLLQKYAATARLADQAAHRVRFAASARIGTEVSALALREARIGATDPRNILGLGYVLVTGRDHQVLKTVNKVSVGDRIGVRFNDGSLTARVDEIYSEKIDNSKTA